MGRKLGWAAAALVSLALGACDSKGGSGGGGPVGTWTLDVDKTVGPMVDKQMAELKKQTDAAPAEQREMMAKLLPTKDKIKAMMVEQFGKMDMTIDIKADHTATMTMKAPSQNEDGTAKWESSGDTITVTPLTDNGKPVEGKKAEPKTAHMRDGQIVMSTDEGIELWLKRK